MVHSILNVMLMAQPEGGEGNPLVSLLPLILIVVVFYFFMIRPQMKKQKELRNFRNNLKQGDKIVTTGGIYGKITAISDQSVTVEVAENVRLKIDKNAVLNDPGDLASRK